MGIQSSLRKRIIQATSLTVIFQGSSQVLRFGSNIILARLLLPESFGLMAIVNIFVLGLSLMSDVGIGANIVRNSRGDEKDFYNTMWTIQVIRGCILAIVCLILANPMGDFYQQTDLPKILRVMAISVFINGFQSTSVKRRERHLNIKTILYLDFFSQILMILVMIIWTYISPTVWGLVAGNMAGVFSKTLLSHIINRAEPNRLCWERKTLKEASVFGKWIFLSTALAFMAIQSDRILLGKLITIEFLGVYHIARAITQIPFIAFQKLSANVVYPALSNYSRESSKLLDQKVQKFKNILLPGLALTMIAIMVLKEPFFKHLYSEEYHDALWIVPYLIIKVWFDILYDIADRLPLVTGKTIILAKTTLASFFFRIAFSLVGFYLGGVHGFIIGQIFGSLFTYLFLLWLLKIEKIRAAFGDVKYTLLLGIMLCGINYIYTIETIKIYHLDVIYSSLGLVVFAIWSVRKIVKSI